MTTTDASSDDMEKEVTLEVNEPRAERAAAAAAAAASRNDEGDEHDGRIPIQYFSPLSNQEARQIDQDIQSRFRKEAALEKLVEKRKKEAAEGNIKNAGDDLVDTDEES